VQADLLTDAGCDFAQGYLYSKPVSPAEFEAMAENHSSRYAQVDLEV
jgi:EAL domain-containing protein (putative c-di-GMP-specific phosphodiesterase class I)